MGDGVRAGGADDSAPRVHDHDRDSTSRHRDSQLAAAKFGLMDSGVEDTGTGRVTFLFRKAALY